MATLVFAACGHTSAARELTTPQERGSCPESTADTRLLKDSKHGYRLLFPITHKVEKPIENETDLVIGSLLNVQDPRVNIVVEKANGRTAAVASDEEVQDAEGRTSMQIADEMAAEVEAAMPGCSVERSFGLTLGYEPAWVLENVPGQDISRQVVVVHDGQLYKLTFMPADK